MCVKTQTHDEQRFRFDFQFHSLDSGQVDDRFPVCCLILVSGSWFSVSSSSCDFCIIFINCGFLLVVTVCFPLYVDRDYILNTVGLNGNLFETGGERLI